MKNQTGSVAVLLLVILVLVLGAVGNYYWQVKPNDTAYMPQETTQVRVQPIVSTPQPTADPVAKASNPDDFSQVLNDTSTNEIDNELNQTDSDLSQLNSQ